jgi:hypothetical protein
MQKQLYLLLLINTNMDTNKKELLINLNIKKKFGIPKDHNNILKITSSYNDYMDNYDKILARYQKKKEKCLKLEFTQKEEECIYLFFINIIHFFFIPIMFIFPILKILFFFLSICLTIQNSLYYTNNSYLSFFFTMFSILIHICIIFYEMWQSMGYCFVIFIIIINLCLILINIVYLFNIWRKKQLLQ